MFLFLPASQAGGRLSLGCHHMGEEAYYGGEGSCFALELWAGTVIQGDTG